ncbi:hypothetical protein [Marinobacter sp. HL-58]|uniref:hypothetical protein n=1 Tax=Marinobacter sp. HL-58 TaxID=1479237 RepID=UPI0012DC55EC|nr:hypothetical protein [Marinobacter sp. HL-58]
MITVGRAWWSAYADAVAADDASYVAKEAILLKMCRELSVGELGYRDWLELYRICLISGLFVVGIELRQRAELAVLVEAEADDASIDTLRHAMSVLIERGSFDEARTVLNGLRQKGDDPDLMEHADWLLRLLDSERPLAYLRPDKFPVEAEVLKATQGASIALVGPVPTRSPNGPEIDGFDLVAKFNYRGGPGGRDPDTQGSRVDISYFNLQQAKFIARKTNPAFISDIPFPVFVKGKGYRLLGRYTTTGRVLMNLQWLLFDSEFNAGPNAIFDLLRFAPATVKVFNTDLMLTAGRYRGYSQPGGEEINYSHSFAKTHDPLMQFRWAKLAWSRRLIDGDERFCEVMASDERDYIKRLQEGHGAIARENLRGRSQ